MKVSARQRNYLKAISENGLCEPKDDVSKRVCRELCAKKYLRPQPLLDTSSLSDGCKNARMYVGYEITAAGRKALAGKLAGRAER